MTKVEIVKLSNSDLVSGLKLRVSQEKELVTQVIYFLAEVQKRRLFFEYGYSSLFQFCMKELGYTEAESQLRINAMRVILEIPEVKDKLACGSLSLTSLSQAQSYFREKDKSNNSLQKSEKLCILERLENKSTRECERELIGLSPQKPLPKEKTRIITETHVQVTLNISNEVVVKLERLKSLLSHKNSNMTQSELIEELADMALQKLSPTAKFNNKAKSAEIEATKSADKVTPNKSQDSKHASLPSKRSVIREVWIRDQERCSYVDPKTQKRCESQYKLELDHIHPKALGGPETKDNLRLLCKAHNQWAAIQIFGHKKMEKYLNRGFVKSKIQPQ